MGRAATPSGRFQVPRVRHLLKKRFSPNRGSPFAILSGIGGAGIYNLALLHWAYMAPLNGASCLKSLNKAVRNVGAHQVHDLIG